MAVRGVPNRAPRAASRGKRIRGRGWIATATFLAWLAAALPTAQAQTETTPLSDIGGEEGFRDRLGQQIVDQLDIIWIEQGRVFFSFGNGKLFGIDVRAAMGNPAAMRSTTEVKWQNFLATFNSHIVLLASRYPAQLYGHQGVRVDESQVFSDQVTRPFNDFATEEHIDLVGYLLTSSALGRTSEEETMRAFELIGYFGGGLGAAYMLSENNVTLPITFRLQKGKIRGRTYDVRVRVRGDEIGFGSRRHPDLSTRLSFRLYNFSEASFDFGWEDVLYGERPKQLRQRITYDLRRYGTYYAGAEQNWDELRNETEFGWLVGAQADVISPGLFEDTRVRTGIEYRELAGSKLPERYLIDVYHRNQLFRGTRDYVIQARWRIEADYGEFQGVGGELRASYLIGSNVPKYSSAYSPADWERFARIYALVEADTQGRARRTWGARLVYAAPFEIDRALESLWERFRGDEE